MKHINMIMKNEAFPPIGALQQIFLQPKRSTSTSQSNIPTAKLPTKLPANAKIVGNYLLGKNIGQGTFAKVHLALHLPTSEKVAIKLIDKKSMRAKDISRVKNEIALLKSVRHRNLVQLYEVIETEKSVLLVTEYVEQGELFRLIIKEKKLGEDLACGYFQQIVAGLDYLHRNRIAHRDLKPQNILLDYDNQLKIIDLGLGTLYVAGKELKSFCGSPCYAAPEIIEGKAGYNPFMSDLWSLGVVLFVMLAGYLPFCDQDINTVFKQIAACNYKIPSHVSAAARDLIEKLLVKQPNQRISLKKIREHEWFNRVTPVTAYGINRGDKLRIEYELIGKGKEIGINEDKVRQGLEKNENNKETASYFILMKKLSKNNEKVQSFIGGKHFNPKYIQTHFNYYDSETQTLSDHLIIEAIEGPQMANVSQQPLASKSSPDIFYAQWNVSPKLQEQRQVHKQQFSDIIKNVLSFVMTFKPAKIPIEQILSQINNQQSRIKRVIFQKKEADFYINKKHKHSRFDLSSQLKKELIPSLNSRKRVQTQRSQSKTKSIQHKRGLSTTNSQKKDLRINSNANQKKLSALQNLAISVEIAKKAEKLLPYLGNKQLSKLLLKKGRSKPSFRCLPPSQKNLK